MSGHVSPQQFTNNAGRLHRLSTWRFVPKGNEVLRVLIHLVYQVLRRQGSWLCTWSMTITVISACECGLLLKCTAMGESSVLLCMILTNDHSFCNGGVAPFYHILLAIPPAWNKIYYTGGLAGDPYHYFELFSSSMAGERICGQQYETGLTPSHFAHLVAGLLIQHWCQGYLYQEILHVLQATKGCEWWCWKYPL